jgi:hypothetical protein
VYSKRRCSCISLCNRHKWSVWDIFFNAATVILVNVTTQWQPGTIICSAIGGFSFAISLEHEDALWAQFMHVCLVQWTLVYCLLFWDI